MSCDISSFEQSPRPRSSIVPPDISQVSIMAPRKRPASSRSWCKTKDDDDDDDVCIVETQENSTGAAAADGSSVVLADGPGNTDEAATTGIVTTKTTRAQRYVFQAQFDMLDDDTKTTCPGVNTYVWRGMQSCVTDKRVMLVYMPFSYNHEC